MRPTPPRTSALAQGLIIAGLRSDPQLPPRLTKPMPATHTLGHDGEDHINIGHDAETRIGQFLRHSRNNPPLEHSYFGPFRSMEVFWHWLRSEERDDRLRIMTGFQLTRARRDLTFNTQVPNFAAIIMDANWQKICASMNLAREFAKTTLPLDCYYYQERDHQGFRIRLPFAQWLTWGFEEIRTALNEDRDPDFRVLLTHPNLDLYTGKPKPAQTKPTPPLPVQEPASVVAPNTHQRRETPRVKVPHKKNQRTTDPVFEALVQELAIKNNTLTPLPGVSHQVSIQTEHSLTETPPMEINPTEAAHLAATMAACIEPTVLDAVVEQLAPPAPLDDTNELVDALAEETRPVLAEDSEQPALCMELALAEPEASATVQEPVANTPAECQDNINAVLSEAAASWKTPADTGQQASNSEEMTAEEEEAFYRQIEEEERAKNAAKAPSANGIATASIGLAAITAQSAELMQRAMDAAQTVSVDALTAVPDAVRLEMEQPSEEVQETVTASWPDGHEENSAHSRGQQPSVFHIDEATGSDTAVAASDAALAADCEAIIDGIAQKAAVATETANAASEEAVWTTVAHDLGLTEAESTANGLPPVTLAEKELNEAPTTEDATYSVGRVLNVVVMENPAVSEDGIAVGDEASPELEYPEYRTLAERIETVKQQLEANPETVFELVPPPAVVPDDRKTLLELVAELHQVTEQMTECSGEEFEKALYRMSVLTGWIKEKNQLKKDTDI